MIICLCGERGSGKDFLADFLCRQYGAYKYAFADPLKIITNNIFPWVPVNPDSFVKDSPVNDPRNIQQLTPRQVWAKVSDALRSIDEYVFLDQFKNNQLQKMLADTKSLHIITDFRFPHEYAFLLEHDIPIVKIEYPGNTNDLHYMDAYIRDFKLARYHFVNNHDYESVVQWNTFVRSNIVGE